MKSERFLRFWQWIKQSWHPKKLDPPTVDPMFPTMDAFQRSAESIRCRILSWEFWASPDGQVREWLRHNSRAVVLLAIPAMIIVPMIGFALAQIAAWTQSLSTIAGHLIIICILMLVTFLIIAFIRSLFR